MRGSGGLPKVPVCHDLGAWLVIQFLSKLDDANPAMRIVTLPITLAYFVFVLLTWIATPLFNTFLRFHSFGRHLLNRKEIWASNLMAVCIITAFVAGGVTIATSGATGVGVFGYWILMMIPVAATFQQSTPKRTLVFASAATIIALLPVYGVVRCLIEQSPADEWRLIDVWLVTIGNSNRRWLRGQHARSQIVCHATPWRSSQPAALARDGSFITRCVSRDHGVGARVRIPR